MRAYTVATVAVTLGVTAKWIDNTLSRFAISGVVRTRQGVNRRLGHQAILTLHIANRLNQSGTILGKAVELAERAGQAGGVAIIDLFSGGRLVIDVQTTAEEITERLALAVEVTPVPKRGRPSAR